MLDQKTLLSLGTALAGTKLVQMLTHFDVDHALGGIGLARRRTHVPDYLIFLGVGAVAGGVTALLLAPCSGAETREKLTRKVETLNSAAQRKVKQVSEEMNGIAGRLSHNAAVHESAE
jgi:hypothetical protein